MTSWIPIGSFSELKPNGTESAGRPVRLNGDVAAITWVQGAVRPLTTTSWTPCGVAVIGLTGVSSTSYFRKKLRKQT